MPKGSFHRNTAVRTRPTDLVIRSNLPQWVVRVLRQSGIKRMSVMAGLSDEQLLEIPGIGRRSLALIRDELGLIRPTPEQGSRQLKGDVVTNDKTERTNKA
jgi:DNA-directed RNA polymerase alpha subunit